MFVNLSILKRKKNFDSNAGIFMLKYVRNELPETFDSMYVKNDIVYDRRDGKDESLHTITIRINIS